MIYPIIIVMREECLAFGQPQTARDHSRKIEMSEVLCSVQWCGDGYVQIKTRVKIGRNLL